MSEPSFIKYTPYQTLINPTFWYKLSQIKLDVDKLSESRKHIWGCFTNLRNSQLHNLPLFEVDCASFNSDFKGPNYYFPVHGFLINKNTVESFKECNKSDLLLSESQYIYENFENGNILKDPSLLNAFFILSFADLKKFYFYYWFAYPASNINIFNEDSPKNVTEKFTDVQVQNLLRIYNEIEDINQKSFFVIKTNADNMEFLTLNDFINNFNNIDNYDDFYFGFSDPSTLELHPGWPMRNYVAFLLYTCPQLQNKTINVLSVRLKVEERIMTCSRSVIFNIKMPSLGKKTAKEFLFDKSNESLWVGWQKNDRGKFGPKFVDMSANMDPVRLSENSVDLNLKLMKWRLLPEIDLDKLRQTRFLLFGAGTLGCAVARNLLAWGARNITLIDNGKVSYSNPVRQNLFFHKDCLNGGRPKAVAAADTLKMIFPCVNSVGYMLNVPMPGHSIGNSTFEDTQSDVSSITNLVSMHDVIFLLMDSRESRWLPTVLASHFNKIVINAALGFDTYLVMRHGSNYESDQINVSTKDNSISGNDLGCYFCNDITAPGDSMKDRTLDQQCTVTRPGVSPIAAALAVELAISILQHEQGAQAPTFSKICDNAQDQDLPDECLLGLLPHSIRGFLSTYSQVLPATKRFQKCIACSSIVVNEYRKSGFDFLLKVFNSAKHLEDITGLTALHEQTNVAEMWEIDSSDDSN